MLDIRPLAPADLPAVLRLSEQAGWNQILIDISRLHNLFPDTCLGGFIDNQLIASATLASFDPSLAWVGMVLVDQSQRGQGFGKSILDAVIDLARQHNITSLGLDATDLGQPVYLKRDFHPIAPVDRYFRPAPPSTSVPNVSPIPPSPISPDDWSDLLDLDRRAVQLDRSSLLRHLAAEPGVHTAVLRSSSSTLLAFAFLRPGRLAQHLGPVIASSPQAAQQVVSELLPLASAPLFIDLPRSSSLIPILQQQNFTLQRPLTRMIRPVHDHPAMLSPLVAAIAGFELG